jgi:phosphodiesterase/alkaline phosphatase D-like protein
VRRAVRSRTCAAFHQRWTAKRRAALILSIIMGGTSVQSGYSGQSAGRPKVKHGLARGEKQYDSAIVFILQRKHQQAFEGVTGSSSKRNAP